ncbi:Qa-SNARE 1 [Giardia muris]|uniref:Qa-SNARE 1 n=1 Tax=Giardia muris TaxID=5742 RepID=A0A4Z1SMY5_GIAMU|nr:Qa-SNARE 1 [Giardia muris]|eukprot:TNJ27084.1 Qa-SNARE 1 [Giardia muris]
MSDAYDFQVGNEAESLTGPGTQVTNPELGKQYAKVDAAIADVDAAIGKLSAQIATASRVASMAELKELQAGVNKTLKDIEARLLRKVADSVQQLEKQFTSLKSAKKLTDEQEFNAQTKNRSYADALGTKHAQLEEVKRRMNKVFENIRASLLAKENSPAGESGGISEERARRLELQDMELVDEREGEVIQAINRDVQEIVGLMKLMAEEVQENQGTIDHIEMNVKKASGDVEQGVEHLEKARKAQKCSRKCMIIWGCVGAILLIIIISVTASIF